MSLSYWFRDYVYIPLGGNRSGIKRQIINILIVWLLTGFWHGASWNFVLWGLLYGIVLIIEKVFLLKYLEKAPAWICHFYTMFMFCLHGCCLPLLILHRRSNIYRCCLAAQAFSSIRLLCSSCATMQLY